MTTDGADVLLTSRENDGDCSEATVEIKIKTLDSQTYTLRVNPCVSVPALKEQVETVTGVLSEQQRLICRGRVLKDDQLLSAYHVEDGHTLHLVVRQPPLPGLSSDPTIASQDPAANTSQNRATQVAHRVVLGTFNVAEQGDAFMPDINRIVSAVLSTIGLTGPASEGVGVFREYISERDAEMPTADVGVDMAHVSSEDATLRDTSRRSSRVSAASLTHPAVIPDSLLTLSQYISHLQHDFDLNVRDYASPLEASRGVSTDSLEADSSNLPHDGRNLMPTPASLAEVVLGARQILIGQAAECLSQLATSLGSQASVSDREERVRIQSSAMRSGALVQNLGALMLELGRTIMTLRMGNIPPEAVVNAGPAVFISRSGPNPIMVQPLPFQPGASFSSGLLANGGGSLSGGFTGSGPVARNIDIRIHAGSLMPGLSASQPRQEGTSQAVPSRPSGTSSGPNSDSMVTETTNRILPVHSLVTALPASGSHVSDAARSGSGVGLFYPLLARIQHLPSNLNLNQRVNNVPNSVESNNTGIDDGSVLGNTVSPVFASENSAVPNREGLSVTSSANGEVERGDTRQETQTFQTQFSNRFDELLHTLFPGEHIDMAIDDAQISSGALGSSDVLSGGDDDGSVGEQATPAPGNDAVLFSNLLRQIMPTLSQLVSENITGSSNVSGSSQSQMDSSSQQEQDSLQDQNDSPGPPHPKRQKSQMDSSSQQEQDSLQDQNDSPGPPHPKRRKTE